MSVRADAPLLALQRRLAESKTSGASSPQLGLLPFEAAQQRWAIPSAEVARVLMPTDIIALTGYRQLPEYVIGALASDNEMLSIVDAGLLLGRERVHHSLKARLVVFADGPLKGIGLLVDRVLARVADDTDQPDLQRLSAASLHRKLHSKSQSGAAKQ